MFKKNPEEEKRRPFIPGKVWDRLQTKHELDLSSESQKNLSELNSLLETNSAVIYLNHTSTLDAPVAISVILTHLTNAKRFLGPVGMKHYDFMRDPSSAILLRALRLLKIHSIPVVQVSDTKRYAGEKRQTN